MVKKINEGSISDYEPKGKIRPGTYDEIYKNILELIDNEYGYLVKDFSTYAKISDGVYDIANAIFAVYEPIN